MSKLLRLDTSFACTHMAFSLAIAVDTLAFGIHTRLQEASTGYQRANR